MNFKYSLLKARNASELDHNIKKGTENHLSRIKLKEWSNTVSRKSPFFKFTDKVKHMAKNVIKTKWHKDQVSILQALLNIIHEWNSDICSCTSNW